jgi:hypothetical protein
VMACRGEKGGGQSNWLVATKVAALARWGQNSQRDGGGEGEPPKQGRASRLLAEHQW